MTLGEFIKELKKECKFAQTQEQIEDIVYSSFRIILEELCSDPDNAEVYFPNLFRLRLIKDSHSCSVNNKYVSTKGEKVTFHYYRIKFQPSNSFKDVINNRKELSEYCVNHRPLYPTLKKPRKNSHEGKPKKERKRSKRWLEADWWQRNLANKPEVPVTITEQDFLNSDIGKLSLEAEKEYKLYLIEKRKQIQREASAMVEAQKRKEKMEVDNRLPEDE